MGNEKHGLTDIIPPNILVTTGSRLNMHHLKQKAPDLSRAYDIVTRAYHGLA